MNKSLKRMVLASVSCLALAGAALAGETAAPAPAPAPKPEPVMMGPVAPPVAEQPMNEWTPVAPPLTNFRISMWDKTTSSDVSTDEFSTTGAGIRWAVGSPRESNTDDEMRNVVEFGASYSQAYADYTDAFLYLLDQGDNETFGQEALETRYDYFLSVASRFLAMRQLSGGLVDVDAYVLWGVRRIDFMSEIHGRYETEMDYEREIMGPEVGLRGVVRMYVRQYVVEGLAEYTWLTNANKDADDYIEYYPASVGNRYEKYLDSTAAVETIKLGVTIGKLDKNFRVELDYLYDVIHSGGSVDDNRTNSGFGIALIYDY